MKYRVLKKAGLKVSEIAFGCMSLGLDHQVNSRLIHQAYEGGVNYFDTADIYQNGMNEITLGKAISAFRNEVIVATKVGNEPNPNGEGWRWNPSKEYILKAVDRSLKRLAIEQIDICQLHGGTIEDPFEDTVEAFELLKEQGKIKYYGLSSIRPNVIARFVGHSDIVSDMLQYSLLDRRPEEEVLNILAEAGVGVMVRGAFAKAKLLKNDLSNYLGYNSESIDSLRYMVFLFSNEKRSVFDVMLQWVLANEKVTSVVLGIRTQAHLKDALSFHGAEQLSQEELAQLSNLLRSNKYENHKISN